VRKFEALPHSAAQRYYLPTILLFAALAAVAALSSLPALGLLFLAAVVVAVAACQRAPRLPAALTAAGYACSVVAGLFLLLHANHVVAVYLYAAMIVTGWLAVTALPVPKDSAPSRAVAWLERNALWLATFGALLLAWLPYWLSYFPGIMSPDSLSEWSQALSMHLSDYSPAVYTLFMHFAGVVLGGPASVSLLQVGLSAALIAALLAYLSSQGAPRWLIAASIAYYIALPIFGTFTVTLWHDIPYSLLVLWVTHAMYQAYVSRGAWLASRAHCWALAAALVLIPLFAHNGLSVVAGVLVGSWIVLRPWRRRVAAIAAGVITGFLCVQVVVYPALGVQSYSKAFASEAMLHQLSAAIVQHGTSGLTSAEKTYLQEIMPFKDWVRKYNPYTPQFLVSPRYNPAYNQAPINRHYGEFLSVWAQVALKYPWSYVGERLSENALVLQPTGMYKIALSGLAVAPNALGLKTHSLAQNLLNTLRRITAATTNKSAIWLWRPFWAMWLLVALTLAAALLRSRRAVLFAAIPWVFQVLGLAISIQGQSVRYYYSLFLIVPYFAGIILLDARVRIALRRLLPGEWRGSLSDAQALDGPSGPAA